MKTPAQMMSRDARPTLACREIVSGQSSLKLVLGLVSIALALILALSGESYQGDAVSYLDMGDNFFSGDWKAIVNGLWSPLFPFLHGLSRWLLRPSLGREPLVVQLTNWMIFLTTVLSFQFFWGELLRLYKSRSGRAGQTEFAMFSDGEFWVFGYAIFLFFHLQLVIFMNPDTLLATIVYLTGGLILRIKLTGPTLGRFCLLGLMLALGFLSKAVMLPLAGVFLTAAVVPSLRQRLVLSYAFASVLAFLAFAGPYIFELSRKEGHVSAGEAGTLNYAWHVNGAPLVHWRGELPGLGTPKHPTRKILSSPKIYEFATPLSATYPPWYDPSYWNEGLHPRFDWVDQISAFKVNLGQFLRAFWSQGVLIASVLVLLAMRPRSQNIGKEYLAIWYVWAPALAAFVIYGALWVEARYLSPFFVLVWGAALILVRLPRSTESRRLLRAVVAVAVTLMGLRVAFNLVEDSVRGHREAEVQMQVAEGLAAKGLQPGEKVAVVAAALGDGWEKFARLSVVAEIAAGEEGKFWAADLAKRTQIYQLLARTGAYVLIAPEIPDWASAEGWERVGNTGVHLLHLSR